MFDTKMKTETKTLTAFTPPCLQTRDRRLEVIPVNTLTEFTGILKLM